MLAMSELTGLRIGGRYRLVRRLKRGLGADLYLAERGGRAYALKLLDAGSRAAGISLRHRHVVALHDVGFDPTTERDYVVMDLVEGHSLDALTREGPLPPARALRLIQQILSALDAAHQEGLVHGHLSPAKVLVLGAGAPEEEVRVLGFGLATEVNLAPPVSVDFADQARRLRARITRRGMRTRTRLRPLQRRRVPQQVKGALLYAAPEVVCERACDRRADLYSIGALLYELLTGRPPLQPPTGGENPEVELRLAIEGQLPTPLAQLRPGIPVELSDLVAASLAKSPADRPASAREFSKALRVAQRMIPVSLVLPGQPAPTQPVSITLAPPPEKPAKLVIRSKDLRDPSALPVALLIAGAVVFLLGALTLALTLRGETDPFRPPGKSRDRVAWAGSAAVTLPPPGVTWSANLEFVYQGVQDGSLLVWQQRPDAPITSQTRPDGVFLGRHEVTVGQFGRYCASVGQVPPVSDAGALAPVTSVTLAEAAAYCRWAGGRLPSAQEVQLAAGPTLDQSQLEPLRNVLPGQNGGPGGVFDLHGNAAEWLEDGGILGPSAFELAPPDSRDPRRGFRLAIPFKQE